MSRYLRTSLLIIALIFAVGIALLWAANAFGWDPRARMGILLAMAIGIGGYTRLFWVGRRRGD